VAWDNVVPSRAATEFRPLLEEIASASASAEEVRMEAEVAASASASEANEMVDVDSN